MAETKKLGMDRIVASVDQAQEAREGELKAAMERLAKAREAQAAQVRDLAQANEDRTSELRDRLDLSDAALAMAGAEAPAEADEVTRREQRAELVQSLKSAYQKGELFTRERIDLAAERMLGDEDAQFGVTEEA